MRRRAGKLAERTGALHETDPGAVLALLAAEGMLVPSRLWEPCCGRGAIVRVLEARGFKVYASDVVRRWESQDSVLDFLSSTRKPRNFPGGILTNPPYENAAAFIRHAIGQPLAVPWAAFLLPLGFWEAGNGSDWLGACRRFVLDERPPSRCYVFANRLPRMHRDGWTGPLATSMEPFAWFVWDAAYPLLGGATSMRRIIWRAPGDRRGIGLS